MVSQKLRRITASSRYSQVIHLTLNTQHVTLRSLSFAGSSTLNVVPFPSSLSTSILPAVGFDYCLAVKEADAHALLLSRLEWPKEVLFYKFFRHAAPVVTDGELSPAVRYPVVVVISPCSPTASYAFIRRLTSTFCIWSGSIVRGGTGWNARTTGNFTYASSPARVSSTNWFKSDSFGRSSSFLAQQRERVHIR